MGDVGLDLTALFAVACGIARTFTVVGVATHKETCLVAELAAVVEVKALFVVVQTCGDANASTWLVTGFADEVDDAAGRVGRQGRSGAATNHFKAFNGVVSAKEHVWCGKSHIAKQHDGQAIFLELNIAGSAS